MLDDCDIVWDIIQNTTPNIKWSYHKEPNNTIFTWDVVNACLNVSWPWPTLIQNPNITCDFIKMNPNVTWQIVRTMDCYHKINLINIQN